jgi:hypothetical protein
MKGALMAEKKDDDKKQETFDCTACGGKSKSERTCSACGITLKGDY